MSCSFVLCGFDDILNHYAFANIRFVIYFTFRDFYDSDKFVLNHNLLLSVLIYTFCFVIHYFICEFPQKRRCQRFHFHKLHYSPDKLLLVCCIVPIELNRSRSPEILVFSFIRSTLYLWVSGINHSSVTFPTALSSYNFV